MRALPFVLFLAGCTSEVTSPIARPMLLAPPTTLERGKTAIAGEVAFRAETAQPALGAWTVATRHAFEDRVEGTLDATYVNDFAALRTPATSSGVAVRAGVRYKVAPHLLVFGALAGGAWDEGALLAGDAGLTVGSDYVFFTARLAVSGTLGGRIVDNGEHSDFCFLCTGFTVDTRNAPHTMTSLETILGFRLPLTLERTLWLSFGIEIVNAVTAVEYHLGAGFGSAIEVVF